MREYDPDGWDDEADDDFGPGRDEERRAGDRADHLDWVRRLAARYHPPVKAKPRKSKVRMVF